MNIFIGNLSLLATENDVKKIFETFGAVASVKIKQKSGQNSRGFGFVSMPDDLQAEAAMAALQDKEFMGRPLNISPERLKAIKLKKDVPVFVAPIIPEKEVKPRRKVYEKFRKLAQPTGAEAWKKRKGRGTAKPWKKKPGGVNKKFRHAR